MNSEFTLRKIEENDHEWLVELHNDPLVLRNVTNPSEITLESHLEWWKKIQNSSSEERLIFCVDGVRAGIVKLYRIDLLNKCCDLGADLHADFRGKGLASPMWKLMLQRAFKVHQLNRVALTTAEYNAIGYRVYKRLGFKEEGKKESSLFRDGRYYDEICMRVLRHEYEKDPSNS